MANELPQIVAFPLLTGERGGLAAALKRARLPLDDLDAPGRHFWRFTTPDDLPVGFGGLEIHGKDALLRSLIVLPPMRHRGYGKAAVAALEAEAAIAGCDNVWVLAQSAEEFFTERGYAPCERVHVPTSIRMTDQFTILDAPEATVMVKRFA
jgi:amino-acid N-acetyltransferase